MTLREQIEAASAKATGGVWECQSTDKEGPDYGVGIVADNLGGLVGAALPWPTEIDSGDFSRVEANAALIVTLVNAYRAGKLLVIEDEADAVRRMRNGMRNAVLSLDAIASLEAATAALAALKGDSA